jgi:hypothetical protein
MSNLEPRSPIPGPEQEALRPARSRGVEESEVETAVRLLDSWEAGGPKEA